MTTASRPERAITNSVLSLIARSLSDACSRPEISRQVASRGLSECPDCNPGTCLCVAERVVMVQRDSQVLTDDRELGRPQFPLVACHADRAAKLVPRQMDASMHAARAQHPGIERCVVGNQEVRPVQQAPQFGPKFAKGWAVADIVPGQSMDVRENEPFSRWPDEPMVPFYNSSILDVHDADRTSAVGMVVCRFEVNCSKICHPPRGLAPSQVAVTIGWANRMAKRLRSCGSVSSRSLRESWTHFGWSWFAMFGGAVFDRQAGRPG